MGFYIKLTETQANQIENALKNYNGIGADLLSKNCVYTNYILDQITGDRYYCIEDIQFNGKRYNIMEWFQNNYPGMTQYSREFVDQFIGNQD